jgi:putative hydrolases of HD superfamily
MSHQEGPAAGLISFLTLAGRLKSTPRTGWLDRGVPELETESVADHTFRVALLAWLAATSDSTLDRERVLKLALVHDLAEAITGDLPPYDSADPGLLDPLSRAEILNRRQERSEERTQAKHQAEVEAIRQLVEELPQNLSDELQALFDEIHERRTPEARFVKEADRLETFLQSCEYLTRDKTWPMESFALEIAETIEHPAMVALRDAVTEETLDPSDRGDD